MKRALSLLLIFSIFLQPLAAVAAGEGDDNDHGSEHVTEHAPGPDAQKQGDDFAHEGDDEGEDGAHATPGDNGGIHLEYTGHDGATHTMDIEREVEVIESGEAGYAIQGKTFRVTVRELPAARPVDVKPRSELRYDTPSKSQQVEFNEDLGKLRDFGAHFDQAKPEPDEKDVASRSELELEESRLRAAAETGAQITSDLLGRLDQADAKIDQAQLEFTPPAPDTLINVGPDFAPPQEAPVDPHAARTHSTVNLAKIAQTLAAPAVLNAADQASSEGVLIEIESALSPPFARILAYVGAHKAELKAIGEFGIDSAVSGFPVAGAAWGVANLVSAAIQGTTLLGTPVVTGWDFAFVAIGALLPGAAIEQESAHVTAVLNKLTTSGADSAPSSASLVKLEKYLASMEQMKQPGTIIAGPGSKYTFDAAPKYVRWYGGELLDYVKKSSTKYVTRDEIQIETHWVENLKSGKRLDFKIKEKLQR